MPVHLVRETGSTNADLLTLAQAGHAQDGLWLRAEAQMAGKGRRGRAWASPPGNLYASTLVRLRADDPPAAGFALAAAVALSDCLAAFDVSTALKWPNDVLAAGAKVAGMLLERSGEWLVVGFGVNITSAPDVPGRATARLADLVAAPPSPQRLLERLRSDMTSWGERWRTDGATTVAHEWSIRAHPVGTPLLVNLPDGTLVEGRFDGLAADGALLLRMTGGEVRTVHAADVFMV